MNYDPEFPIRNSYDENETLAYQLLCIYIKMRQEIIPNYIHSRIPSNTKDLRKSLLFKHLLKFVKTNRHRFKGYQFVLFMRAQLEVMRHLQQQGAKILIEASILCGTQADKRWSIWKNWVRESNKITKITYAFVPSNLNWEFENTLNSIKDMCDGELSFGKFSKESPVLLKLVILKKISPVYINLSCWVKKLPEQIKQDVYDLANIKLFDDFDMKDALSLYQVVFKHELN